MLILRGLIFKLSTLNVQPKNSNSNLQPFRQINPIITIKNQQGKVELPMRYQSKRLPESLLRDNTYNFTDRFGKILFLPAFPFTKILLVDSGIYSMDKNVAMRDFLIASLMVSFHQQDTCFAETVCSVIQRFAGSIVIVTLIFLLFFPNAYGIVCVLEN